MTPQIHGAGGMIGLGGASDVKAERVRVGCASDRLADTLPISPQSDADILTKCVCNEIYLVKREIIAGDIYSYRSVTG